MAFSLHTLPVELVYRVLDNLDNKRIFWSCQSVCTRLDAIINSYRPYQVIRAFTLYIHSLSNAPFFFSFCIPTSRFISHSDDHWARGVASNDPHDHIRSIIFYCSVWVQLLTPHRCHHLGKQQKYDLAQLGAARPEGGLGGGYPLLRWKIWKAIYSHFGEILDDLSPILVIISNGFSFILEAVFNEFSSISEIVSHEFSPVLETAFSEFSRI